MKISSVFPKKISVVSVKQSPTHHRNFSHSFFHQRKKLLFQSDWSLVLVLVCTDTCGSKPFHVPSSVCLAVSNLSPRTSIRYTQSPTLLHGSMGTNSISETIISRKKSSLSKVGSCQYYHLKQSDSLLLDWAFFFFLHFFFFFFHFLNIFKGIF